MSEASREEARAEAGVRRRQGGRGNPGARPGWARATPNSSVPGSVKRREPEPRFPDLSTPRGSERRPPPATDTRSDPGHPDPLHRADLALFWKLQANPLLSRPPSAQHVPGLTRVSQRTLLSAAIFCGGSRAEVTPEASATAGAGLPVGPGELGGSFSGAKRQGLPIRLPSVLLFSNVGSRGTQPVCLFALFSVVRFSFF